MVKKDRLKIYRTMLYIYKQVIIFEASNAKSKQVNIAHKSFNFRNYHTGVYIEAVHYDHTHIYQVRGYCSILRIIRHLYLYNASLNELIELYECKPHNEAYWFNLDDKESRIDLLETIINTMRDGVTHT